MAKFCFIETKQHIYNKTQEQLKFEFVILAHPLHNIFKH